ncbi:MAG: hypothetical protein IJY25_02660 [Bacilli bacterium]|nr:hypothetical protein [Bacilli bacterium]
MNMRNIKRKLSVIWKKLIYDKSGTRVSTTKVALCILLLVISIGIGYSSLTTSLNITGLVTKVRQKSDIRITNLVVSELNNESQSNYSEYNKQSISVGTTLPKENSTITYKVEVTNIGNVEMGLLEITGLPDALKYELTDYTLKEKICNSTDSSKCTLGAVKEFYLTIKYNDSVDIYTAAGYETDFIYNLNLDFNFQPVYNVTYTDITVEDTYPSIILETETLEVDLGENAPSNVKVLMSEVEITNYTYENGVLTIPNVSGDVEIQKVEEQTTQVYKPQYYSWSSGSIGDTLPDDASKNVSDIDTQGYPFYLGLDVDSDNNVSTAYACFVRNKTEYCLKGYDASAYETNKTILEDAFDSCTFNNDNPYCYADDLFANANSNGNVSAGGGYDVYCYVYGSGRFGCYTSGVEEPEL